MKNPEITIKNPDCWEMKDAAAWHVRENAEVSIKAKQKSWSHKEAIYSGSMIDWAYTEWKENEKTTKPLHFDLKEVVYEDNAVIIFKRDFVGETWYLRINKVI